MTTTNKIQSLLRECNLEALRAVNGENCVRDFLSTHTIADESWQIIAIGKAAYAMAQGAIAVLGDRLQRGLLISAADYLPDDFSLPKSFQFVPGNHPVPDDASLRAGEALLTFLSTVPASDRILFLISGGSSSLVEVLPPHISLSELQKLNIYLLASGLPITQINTLRKRVSRIKGGKTLQFLGGKRVTALYMSDVSGNDLSAIGSGLLVPDRRAISVDLNALPSWLNDLLAQSPKLPPRAESPLEITHHVVSDIAKAIDAAASCGRCKGYTVRVHAQALQGDAVTAARVLTDIALQERGVLHVWGGETTVSLPAQPGRGGRNCAMALAAARYLRGVERALFMATATDGKDGNSGVAGAMVDGHTIEQGLRLEMDDGDYLQRADAATYLDRTGSLLHYDASGANVADLVLAYIDN